MGFNLTPIVKNLLLINVGVFLIGYILRFDLPTYFGLRNFISPYFQPYQLVTNIFIHADFRHLFGNMLGLFFFGPLLESFLGTKKFLVLYFVCGIGACLIYSGIGYFEINSTAEAAEYYLKSPTPDNFLTFVSKHAKSFYHSNIEYINDFSHDPTNSQYITETKELVSTIYRSKLNGVLMGASGAIFGIYIAFAMLFPNTELQLLFLPVPIKAKYLVGAYAIFEVYQLIKNNPNDNVAHLAHIGGMIFAFILIKYWQNNRNAFY